LLRLTPTLASVASGAASFLLLALGATIASRALAQGIPYEVEITGVDGDLRDLIEESSRLLEAEDEPPAGLAGLNQRAESDVEDFQRVLRSEGYYGARITLDIDGEMRPARVTVGIAPGAQFQLTRCAIMVTADVPEELPRDCPALDVAPGVPARSATVIEAEARLRRRFLERGYPDVAIERTVLVDHATSSMDVTYAVTPGPEVRLGSIMVSGQQRTDPAFLERLGTWVSRVRYDVRLIDTYRERLNGLDLFDSVTLTPRADDGELRAVDLLVHERAPRTIGGGLRYASDEGLGLIAYWEHRNFMGSAERLRADLGVAELAQSLTLTYALPHRPAVDQRLDFVAAALHEITDAYTRSGGEISAALTTPITRYLKAKFGAAFEVYEVEDANTVQRRTNIIGSLPVDGTYDGTDSLLDPTEGERFLLRGTPVFGTSDGALLFLRVDGEASGYVSFGETNGTVLAGRIRFGTILGETVEAIPRDWRFYAGGGGSVRGFGYQRIGPLDEKNDPVGGRSLAEAGVELRQRVTETLGGVLFVEAGSVSRTLAGFEEPRYGAGIGVRYYTQFGPIRADIATPLNPRSGDASVQLYISVGQAF
jgi:translocation and assembly module TamA